jgi:hypothetical protein
MSSQMEILSNKFNSLLTQYKENYNNFLNTVGSNDNSFKTVPDSAFVSLNNIENIQVTDVDKCLTSCSSNKLCSGATFDNEQNSCLLSSGSGDIIHSPNQTAIIKQALYYSYQLEKINNELLSVNTNIMTLANSRIGDYQETQKMSVEKSEILQNNYKTLEEERFQIAEMIRQYETLNSANEDASISIKSYYYTYMIYLLVAIFLIFLLFKYTLSSEQNGGSKLKISKISPFIYGILVFIIIFSAILKN